jgi:hypothetical protein
MGFYGNHSGKLLAWKGYFNVDYYNDYIEPGGRIDRQKQEIRFLGIFLRLYPAHTDNWFVTGAGFRSEKSRTGKLRTSGKSFFTDSPQS